MAVFTDVERMEGWDCRQAGELNRWIDLDVPLRVVGVRGPIWRCCAGV